MITNSLARVARSTCVPTPIRATFYTSGQNIQLTASAKRTHQRRNSSSKASVPPSGAPPNRNRSSDATQPSTSTTGRAKGRKAKAPVVESGFSHLPSVPSTQHLKPADINVSTFFSLHRPISVTNVVPQNTTLSAFSSIFDPKIPGKYQTGNVINTIGTQITELEETYTQEQGFLEEPDQTGGFMEIQSARSGVPQDIPPHKFSNYVPFVPPPAPERKVSAETEKKMKRKSRASKPRTWTTTITVTEHTSSDGSKSYVTASTPLERLPMGELHKAPSVHEPVTEVTIAPMQQPFLQRMRIRQVNSGDLERGQMYAISVKRQRKLKMKKHKYKKLMKRTRNVRRRLGKL